MILWDYRCLACDTLLFRAALRDALVEIKCRKCHRVQVVDKSAVPVVA